MDWEVALLLCLGMPFALFYWAVSGMGQVRRSIAGRLAGPRTIQEPCA